MSFNSTRAEAAPAKEAANVSPLTATMRRRPNSEITVTEERAECSPAPTSRKRFSKKQVFFIILLQLLVIGGVFALGWYLGFYELVGSKKLKADITGKSDKAAAGKEDGKDVSGKDISDSTPDEIENLYDLLVESIAHLEEWGIEYWLISGSLIGALRNTPAGPMSWDDDHDIGVFEDQLPRLKEMFGNMTSLVTIPIGFGHQLGLKDTKGRKIRKSDGELQFDIFVFGREGRSEGNYVIDKSMNWWPGLYYENKEEVFPTVDCYQWDIKCQCPRLAFDLVKREFGDDVLYTAVQWNHAEKSNIKYDLRKEENRAMLLPQMTNRIQKKLTFI